MASDSMSQDIRIGTQAAQENVKKLNIEIRDLNSAFLQSVAPMGKWGDTVAGNEKKLATLIKQEELQRQKIEQISAQLRNRTEDYGADSAAASRSREELAKATTQLAKYESEIAKTTSRLGELQKSHVFTAESFEKAGKAMSVASAAIAAGAAVTAKAAIEWESAFAGVRKTVDGTKEELQAVSDGIRNMAKEIPMAAKEIAAIAENAGQLGIQTDSVLDFTRVMADLGVATNLSGEQAAQTFAKFANITGMAQSDFDRLGSSIVALGNNLATTESDIAAMGLNLSAAGSQAGMTEAEILGLAGALSSVGLQAQAGGTAFSKVINSMTAAVETGSADLQDFARIAGMTADQFATAYKNNAAGALISFVQGLGDVERHGASAIVLLDELGLTEARMRDALTRAANASDLFGNSIDLASKAWEENNALTKEAEQRYATVESQIQLAKNSLNDTAITIGQDLLPHILKLTDGVRDVAEWFSNLDEDAKNLIVNFLGVTAVMGPLLLATGQVVTALKAYKEAQLAATAAQKAFNLAANASVVGLVAVGLSAVIAVGGAFVQKMQASRKEVEGLTTASTTLTKTLENTQAQMSQIAGETESAVAVADRYISKLEELEAAGLDNEKAQREYASILELLSQIIPDVNIAIDEGTGIVQGGAASIRDMTAAWRENVLETAKLEAQKEIISAYAQALVEAETNQAKLDRARTNAAIIGEELAAAEKALWESNTLSSEESQKLSQKVNDLTDAWRSSEKELKVLEAAVKVSNGTLEENKEAYEIATDALEGYNAPLSETNELTEENASATEAATMSMDELDDRIQSLQKSYKELNGVLADVASGNDISASQMLDLIRTYPELAESISYVNGALTLEKGAIEDLLRAQIDSEVKTIDSQIRRVEAVVNASGDSISAMNAEIKALGLLTEAYAGSAQDEEVRNAAKQRLAQLNAQKVALEALKNEIGKAAPKKNSGGSKSAKKEVDPYQEQVDAFNETKKELEHLWKMDAIEEKQYFRDLADLRDKHLQIDTDEWRKATEEVYAFEKAQKEKRLKNYSELNQELKKQYENDTITQEEYLDGLAVLRDGYLEESTDAWRDATKEMVDVKAEALNDFQSEWSTAIKELLSEYDGMVSKLQNYGELFAYDKNDKMKLESLEEQTKTILRYGDALTALQEKEIPEGLMDNILGMGVEEGLTYANKLLNMSDSEYDKYIEAWNAKQQAAQEVAERFYQSELDALNDKFVNRLPEELSGMKDELYSIGSDAGQGIADGIQSKGNAISSALIGVVNKAIADARRAIDAHSPARVPAELIGKPWVQGIAAGIEENMNTVKNAMSGVNQMLSEQTEGQKVGDVQALNAINSMIQGVTQTLAAGNQGGQPIVITIDGMAIAQGTLPYTINELRHADITI